VISFVIVLSKVLHKKGQHSAIFLKKIGSGIHRVTQNLIGEREVIAIVMPGKKGSRTPFQLLSL
jgi:hypothetical protein